MERRRGGGAVPVPVQQRPVVRARADFPFRLRARLVFRGVELALYPGAAILRA